MKKDNDEFNQIKLEDCKIISQKENIVEFVYRPENYPGPIAMNATVKNEKNQNNKTS